MVTPETNSWQKVLEVAKDAGFDIVIKPIAEWAEFMRAADSAENEVMLGLLDVAGGLDLGGTDPGPVVLFEDPADFGEQIVGSHVRASTVRQFIAGLAPPAGAPRDERAASRLGAGARPYSR